MTAEELFNQIMDWVSENQARPNIQGKQDVELHKNFWEFLKQIRTQFNNCNIMGLLELFSCLPKMEKQIRDQADNTLAMQVFSRVSSSLGIIIQLKFWKQIRAITNNQEFENLISILPFPIKQDILIDNPQMTSDHRVSRVYDQIRRSMA